MPDPLHICFLSQEYPPETGWGGIGSYTYDMAHALIAAGHRATVIARAEGEESIRDDNGVAVHRVGFAPRFDRMPCLWRLNRFWPGFAWAAMRRLRSIHRRDRVDAVEAGECRADGFFLAWLPKWVLPHPRPRIVTRLHLAWIFVDRNNRIEPDLKKRLIYWLEKQSIVRADTVTAPSAAVAELTRTWVGAGLPVRVVPNPIDLDGFVPDGNAREREVLFVGRFERGKGLAMLCDAVPLILRRCPEARVRMLGHDGVDEQGHSWRARMLAATPEELRARIAFEQAPREQLAEKYRRAGVCIVPSLWENCPYVVLEAMACGTPVVAMRTGGIPELVEDGRTGLLAAPGDPQAFSDAICELLNNPEKCRRMGMEGRRRVEQAFGTQHIVSRMLEVYRGLEPRQTCQESL